MTKKHLYLVALSGLLCTAASIAGAGQGIGIKLASLEGDGQAKELALQLAPVPENSVAGNYLSGRYAQQHQDWDRASLYLGDVLEADPENLELQKRTMVLAMGAGNMKRAAALARAVTGQEKDNALALLFLSLEALTQGDYKVALAHLDRMPAGGITDFVGPLMKGWAHAGLGAYDFKGAADNPVHRYHDILMAHYLGKKDKAAALIEKTLETGGLNLTEMDRLGDICVDLGEKDKALAIYKAILQEAPANADLLAKADAIEKGKSLDFIAGRARLPDVKRGIALALFDMGRILFREYSDDSARVFGQMALQLGPDMDEVRLLLAHVAARNESYEEAIRHYMAIGDKDRGLYLDSRRRAADLMARSGTFDKAVSLLENLAAQEKDIHSRIAIGDLYRNRNDYKDALAAYETAVRSFHGTVPPEFWHLLYYRGMVLERLGEWERAEKDLKAALAYQPDQPYILNYLGYAWADQGKNLDESLEMIRKAADLQPGDGYITDSLGWVLYRREQYSEAVKPLEKAVELLPYDPVINDHLGDAYWRVGRRLEAQFQWQRAINASETEEQAAQIREKMDVGPQMEGPAPAAKAASSETAAQRLNP